MNPSPTVSVPSSARLSLGRRLGYGIGDAGFNLFFTTASLYLLFFYTDVLGLAPATAGWVFAGALIWDAVFDPLMGYVSSRTKTRWGSYRPYILFGAVPMAASWALIFVPTGLAGTPLMLFAFASHVVFRTLYAVVNMPFLAMSATLTRESAERGRLAAVRMIAAATSGLIAAVFTLRLSKSLGGGQQGFFWTAIIYGVIATAILMVVFASTREVVVPAQEQRPRARDMVRMLASNRAFWIVSAAMLLGAIGSTFFQKTLPYFLKYRMGREDLISPALGVLALSVMVSIPLWSWVTTRTSKRTMWLVGSLVSLTGSALLWALPPTPVALLVALVPVGFGAGASYLGFWGMIPDTVEYGEWRSGVRAEGAVFGLVSLIQKASLGLAAAALGEVLSTIGYRANVVQTPSTLAALGIVMIVAPALLTIGAAIVIAFYPLDHPTHGRIVRILEMRRARRR